MKELNFNQMQFVNAGIKVPTWLECAGAVVATGIFFGGLFVTTGPIGLYAANAIFGPTLVGLAWNSCAT
jgi:hypothetical protein